LQWLVKSATQLCTSQKDCNKLDLTAAQYFWLVNHNDWSRWLAISSPHIFAVLFTVLLVGLLKKKLNLDIKFYFPEWHTQHRWRCSKRFLLNLQSGPNQELDTMLSVDPCFGLPLPIPIHYTFNYWPSGGKGCRSETTWAAEILKVCWPS
jgi:hypothetical protein